ADTAGRRLRPRRHDVDIGDTRRFVDPNKREIIQILLLDLAILEGDLAISGQTEAHDGRAFELRLDALGVDIGSAIDRGIDPRHSEISLLIDCHFDDGRDIADEAAVYGDAKAVSF